MVALPLSLVATTATVVAVRQRLLDQPNERSSHAQPTPRGGGIGPALAVVALALATRELRDLRWPLVLIAGTFGALGLVDDVRRLPSRVRLGVQLLVVVLATPWIADQMPGTGFGRVVLVVGAAIAIVAYANAFNFMDGVNGISALHVAVVGTTWWLVADGPPAIAGATLAWAALGFLPFNFPRARVFLGDVGSYFLGAALVVVAIAGFHRGLPFEAMAAPMAPYLADTASTLVRRLRRGDVWHAAHREHAYQQLVAAGWSHAAVALFVAAVVAGCGALGWVSTWGAAPTRAAADVGIVLLAAAYVAFGRRSR